MKNKVLVLAPHMDDEALGCAGTICKHKENHDWIAVIFVAHRVYGHRFDQDKDRLQREHALKAKKILRYDQVTFLNLADERLDLCLQEIIIPLEKSLREYQPNIVYCPFSGDNNQDHRAVFEAARVVFRPAASGFLQSLCLYEIPSSTEQSPALPQNAFLPNFYVDIKNYIEQKIKAISCYDTEKRIYPHPRSPEAVRVLAKKRGIEIGFEYAEAFMNIRRKWA